MEYSSGSTLAGPHQTRWSCDHKDCTATAPADTADARLSAEAVGWRSFGTTPDIHICPTHVETIGRG